MRILSICTALALAVVTTNVQISDIPLPDGHDGKAQQTALGQQGDEGPESGGGSDDDPD